MDDGLVMEKLRHKEAALLFLAYDLEATDDDL